MINSKRKLKIQYAKDVYNSLISYYGTDAHHQLIALIRKEIRFEIKKKNRKRKKGMK